MSRQFATILTVVMICCGFSSGSAAENVQLGLYDAWQGALESDTQWRSVKASIAAQREILPQAKAALLPSLGASASVLEKDTNVSGDNSNSRAFDDLSTSYAVELRQPLVNLSAIKLYKSAQETMQSLEFQLALEQQSLAVRLSRAYFDLLLAQESVALAESEFLAIQRQLEQTQQRFKVGLVSKTDVLEAQAAEDQSRVLVATSQNQRVVALENLNIIVGQPLDDIFKLKAEIPLKEMSMTSDQWVDQVLTGNLRLKLAQLNQSVAALTRDATKASYWPTVDAVASYSNVDELSAVDTTQFGLALSWQPFQGGGLRSRVREADLRYQATATDVAGLEQTLSRDARNLFQTLKTDIVQIHAQQRAIASSESALEATRAGYEVGTRNVVDVLNAQRTVFRAKRDYAQARFTWILRRLEAAFLDSSLDDADLQEIDAWLMIPLV